KINKLTSQGKYELRVDMSDFNGNKLFAKYSSFLVGNVTTKYKLKVGGYSGNSGDSMTYSNGMSFSTKDRDNDLWSPNCAVNRYGAWWYKDCTYANLNGRYVKGGKQSSQGLYWWNWKRTYHSMKSTVMMIRKLN
ncbi:ficolin-2-like, partial [Mytilus edulis]|uniref:ficolin-2-like n=1 Tax=Mytilus edulis TaxID=6550 RepID=UPI0039F059DE